MMNIMIVTNSAYLGPTYTMLYSLFLCHEQEEMNIYLPYEDLKQEELLNLKIFVETFRGKTLYPLYVGKMFKEKVVSNNGINVETYYRILGINMLPESLDKILYLDVDMIIQGSLKRMYEIDMGNAPFAACEDIYGIINGFHEANMRRLEIPENYSYFNAGVMLYNVNFLRNTNAVEFMLDNVYKKYKKYEYNDQDVMNELYYNKVRYLGWDEYNCPPIWCYLNKKKMQQGILKFADYNEIREMSKNPEKLIHDYQDITKQIYQNAKVIHYLGNTKPWSKTREKSKLYELYDEAYKKIVNKMLSDKRGYEYRIFADNNNS